MACQGFRPQTVGIRPKTVGLTPLTGQACLVLMPLGNSGESANARFRRAFPHSQTERFSARSLAHKG